MKSIEQRIADELGVQPSQVQAAVELLDGGWPVPFIAPSVSAAVRYQPRCQVLSQNNSVKS